MCMCNVCDVYVHVCICVMCVHLCVMYVSGYPCGYLCDISYVCLCLMCVSVCMMYLCMACVMCMSIYDE